MMDTQLVLHVDSNISNFVNDFNDVVRAYEIGVRFDATSDSRIFVNISVAEGRIVILYDYYNLPEQRSYKEVLDVAVGDESELESDLTIKKNVKRSVKRHLYRLLSEWSGVSLPYGSLTGIRPTKMYYTLLEEGMDPEYELAHTFDVSPSKVELIRRIIDVQRGIYGVDTDKLDLFLNIPICPTRCSYCSFISIERSKLPRAIIDAYIGALADEIRIFSDIGLADKLRSIYIGGGTPGVLTAEELERVISPIADIIADRDIEFTVECGRPETIDADKVRLLRDCRVTRVSVNPQTFNERTLQAIGRTHTLSDVYHAYDLVKGAQLDVNMDLIAMLPEETLSDFVHSIDEAVSMAPDNLTVHTFALKRGSKLYTEERIYGERRGLATEMIDHAYSSVSAAGYEPYYMYRLKNMAGALENTGYTLPRKACVYNVDIMEETHSIYAIGAGAISKRVSSGGLLERYAQSKDLHYYLAHYDEIIAEKTAFFAQKN